MTTPKQKKQWKNQDFDPLPLDKAILEALPHEGAKIGQYLWDGKKATTLVKELDPINLTANMVGARLSTMQGYGLVIQVKVLGSSSNQRVAYQRTKKGSALIGLPETSEQE